MSLLEQDTIKKVQVEEYETRLEFEASNDGKKYKLEGIWDSVVYTKKSKSGYLPGLYYLVLWKGYLKEKNTYKPILAVQHF